MNRIRLGVVMLVLLAPVPALAGPADYALNAYRTPGFAVLVPEGTAIADLGPRIESLYASVSDLWLPDLGVCGGLSDFDQAAVPYPESRRPRPVSPDDMEIAERLPGSCAPDPCTVIAYRTAQDLQWDYRSFDVTGLCYSSVTYDPEMERSLQRIDARVDPLVDLPLTYTSTAVSGYPDGPWESILAHELTHVLQRTTGLTRNDAAPVPLELLYEGMARLTQFRLGFLGSFDVTVLQPAARWIQLGGRPDAPPHYILYEAGAALVDAMCRAAGEAAFWRIFSPLGYGVDPLDWYDRGLTEGELTEIDAAFEEAVGGSWTTYMTMPFEERFRLSVGAEWSAFLEGWIAEMNAGEVTPEGDAAFEWYRRSIWLRVGLLSPVLDPETIDRLDELARRIFDGAGNVADVDEAERLLGAAPSQIGPETVEELAWRVPTLTRKIKSVGGFGAAQSIYRISNLRTTADEDPQPYVQAFVDAVNDQLIWPLPPASAPAD